MNKKISIIIPVYNAEKFIKNCIDCLKAQTYQNFEAIFINDGSNDKSLELLNKYKTDNMIVINQIKSGVSAARNKGLEIAKGNFISFLDIDDKYRNDFLEKMLVNLEKTNTGVAICNYTEICSNEYRNINFPFQKTVLEHDEIVDELIARMIGKEKNDDIVIWGTVWRTMISARILKELNMRFDEKTAYSEDYIFLLELFAQVDKIAVVEDNLYYYYRNQNSALNKYITNYLEKNLYIHKYVQMILKKYKLYERIKNRYKKNQFRMYTVMISNAVRQKEKKKQELEIKMIIEHFQKNNNFQEILKIMNYYEIISYYLLKFKSVKLLRLIYLIKEKIRTRNFFRD